MKIENYYVLVNKYNQRITEICNQYKYPSNISHLLYIIIPIFVIKYGIEYENLIFQTFSSIPIIIKDNHDKTHQAFYTSIPYKIDNIIKTKKFIVLNHYENISIISLLENIIHEYNHAINSYRHEILIKDNILFLRSGLTYSKYNLNSLKPLEKEKSFVLEEILNTSQVNDMINLITNIPINTIEDNSLKSTIYSIQKEVISNYESHSYLFQMTICKYILENKTFTSTLNKLRITGTIEDIEGWFNNITGNSNSYQNFIDNLEEILAIEINIPQKKIKYFSIKKIKNLTYKIINIINIFNQNCTYK